jgi:putative molybdopterin biosynthesis protein
MPQQEQFLDVIDRDLAEKRFHQALNLAPLGEETIPLSAALGRVLCHDVVATVDVPSFDRSNYDGFAVRAADTFGAAEETPRRLRLLAETIASAVVPKVEVAAGTAATIATGGMVPRGADAIVMVEHADEDEKSGEVLVRRAVTPGFGIAFAGTDVAAGETVLRRGVLLTSRETGVLAAIGANRITVWRRPRVAILSTGDELIAPGQPMRPPLVYDSNARILADAVRELGGEPVELGIVADDLDRLRRELANALASCDVVLLSGGTSKGAGDLSYRVASELRDPGIVVHGVALKPGKPVCLAASGGKPVVVLPGFPTSAIFTFHEFVAPVIRRLAGAPPESRSTVPARLAVKVNSDPGRTEYLLVGLVEETCGEWDRERGQAHFASRTSQNEPVPFQENPRLVAYPMGKGSGSVTTFSQADGFITIGRHEEIVEAGAIVAVQLLGRDLRPADLVVIGSHCVGLDYLLGRMQESGYSTRFLAVGSTAGLEAVRRGQCDLAGIHLLDAASGIYNRSFLTADMELLSGYGRQQGVVYRRGDLRFEGKTAAEAVDGAKRDPACVMVNRNQGSGTRILIDQLLGDARPAGYAVQSRSHNAVAAAVAQGRADWGVAIENVAHHADLGFLPLAREEYDFAVAHDRRNRPAVQAFARLLADERVRSALADMGFAPPR